MDIYLDASRLGIFPPLFTSPSGDSCVILIFRDGKFYQLPHEKENFNFKANTLHPWMTELHFKACFVLYFSCIHQKRLLRLTVQTWYISFNFVVIKEKPVMNSSKRCLRMPSCSFLFWSRFDVTSSSSFTLDRYASSYKERYFQCCPFNYEPLITTGPKLVLPSIALFIL